MKILGVSASPRPAGNCDVAVRRVLDRLDDLGPAQLMRIHDFDIRHCDGCRACMKLRRCAIRGDDFYRCQQCTRFLYHADVVAEPGEAKPHEAEAAEAAAGRQS